MHGLCPFSLNKLLYTEFLSVNHTHETSDLFFFCIVDLAIFFYFGKKVFILTLVDFSICDNLINKFFDSHTISHNLSGSYLVYFPLQSLQSLQRVLL